MNTFPDYFCRKVCNDEMEKNQNELIKEVRKQFHVEVLNTIKNCEPLSTLEFPHKLWQSHRVTIIKELLERFGKVRIQILNSSHNITKLITLPEDIPNHVDKVLIEFVKE